MLRPEIGAQLAVESKNGIQYPLYDMAGNGNYQIDQLVLNPAEEYRLRISTQGWKTICLRLYAGAKQPTYRQH
jgi:hypothetical protein